MSLLNPGPRWAWIIVLGLPLAACTGAAETPAGGGASGGASGSGAGAVGGAAGTSAMTMGGTSGGGTTGGTATGGTGGSTGGAAATGGAPTGGSSPGGAGAGGSGASGGDGAISGAPGTAGRVGRGGRGSGGAPAAGGAGTGGGNTAGASTGGSGGVSPGTGCGATPLESGRASIDVDGTMREYILKVPDGYDANKPYKLIFGWHWRGGVANDVATGTIIGGPYYGLESRAAGSAIFVSPEGIDMGWANTGGRDIAFLHAMLDLFNSKLCIDQGRIFSTGFSYGGMMSDTIGCEMADVFRAIAPNSGALYSGCKQANDHPIAALVMHGNNDTTVPLADGQAARDIFLTRNACAATTTPVDPSPCVSYDGCTDGYPVVYCEFSGGHMPWSSAPDTVWKFFNQF
jgi:polyhydroxybutyrate depolymerase